MEFAGYSPQELVFHKFNSNDLLVLVARNSQPTVVVWPSRTTTTTAYIRIRRPSILGIPFITSTRIVHRVQDKSLGNLELIVWLGRIESRIGFQESCQCQILRCACFPERSIVGQCFRQERFNWVPRTIGGCWKGRFCGRSWRR